MKINEMKESKYLKKEDVGQGKLLTISRIAHENVALESQPEEMKYVLFFKEESKGMVLNWTNIQLVANVTDSDDTDNWVGKQIVAYNDPNVSFAGKITGGIRIRAPKQPSTKTESENPGAGMSDGFDDSIPF